MAIGIFRSSVRTAAFVGLWAPALLFAQASPPSAGAAGDAATRATAGAEAKSLSPSDRKFITEAAQAGLAEVEFGQLAAEKAESPRVKEFGERMVREHGASTSELQQLASAKGVDLPKQPGDKHRRKLRDLQRLSGAKFDREYMELMVEEHGNDAKEFERQSRSASDPQLKAFAEKTLSMVREHHQLAKDTEAVVRGRPPSATKDAGA